MKIIVTIYSRAPLVILPKSKRAKVVAKLDSFHNWFRTYVCLSKISTTCINDSQFHGHKRGGSYNLQGGKEGENYKVMALESLEIVVQSCISGMPISSFELRAPSCPYLM